MQEMELTIIITMVSMVLAIGLHNELKRSKGGAKA